MGWVELGVVHFERACSIMAWLPSLIHQVENSSPRWREDATTRLPLPVNKIKHSNTVLFNYVSHSTEVSSLHQPHSPTNITCLPKQPTTTPHTLDYLGVGWWVVWGSGVWGRAPILQVFKTSLCRTGTIPLLGTMTQPKSLGHGDTTRVPRQKKTESRNLKSKRANEPLY